MNRSTLRRTAAGGAALVALTMGLAACGDDSSSESNASDTPAASADSGDTSDAGADTFGPGCSAIPKDGKGSFNGMVTERPHHDSSARTDSMNAGSMSAVRSIAV